MLTAVAHLQSHRFFEYIDVNMRCETIVRYETIMIILFQHNI